MPEKKYHIFGRDGVKRLADSLERAFPGRACRCSKPSAKPATQAALPSLQTNGEAAAAFRAVVANLLKQLGKDV